MKERDILYEVDDRWVMYENGLYFVMKSGITHSKSEETAYKDISLAIARAKYLASRDKQNLTPTATVIRLS